MNRKEKYEEAVMEVILFESEDIISTSGGLVEVWESEP